VLTLRGVSRDLPVIWPVHPLVDRRLDEFRLKALLAGERVACLPYKSHPEFVALLNNATCVLTDACDVQAEASALGIPWLALGATGARRVVDAQRSRETHRSTPAQVTRAVWECIFNGGSRGAVPERRDGKCAARLVDDLQSWLGRSSGVRRDHSKPLEVPA
jgi:UDP-N-acetylglucosamine 2-epimerase